jgi:GxxExxY protein
VSELNVITGEIVDAAIQVHRELGPGLLERAYEPVLAGRLRERGLKVLRQVPVDLRVEGVRVRRAFRADLLVERAVVVEVKSVKYVPPLFRKQLLTYLRLLDCRVGLLLNFRSALMKDGIIRIVNRLEE